MPRETARGARRGRAPVTLSVHLTRSPLGRAPRGGEHLRIPVQGAVGQRPQTGLSASTLHDPGLQMYLPPFLLPQTPSPDLCYRSYLPPARNWGDGNVACRFRFIWEICVGPARDVPVSLLSCGTCLENTNPRGSGR